MSKPFTIYVEKKKALTPVFRGGYVNFFEPKAFKGDDSDATWGMQLMFPKNGVGVAEFMVDIKKIYVQVLVDKFGKEKAVQVAKIISDNRRFPVRDGDNPSDTSGLANSDQLVGHHFMNANNKFRQPMFIGPAGKVVDPEALNSDDVYSGAWYRAMLEFWYYSVKGNQGISTSLAAFMKVKDDSNLGAGTTSSEAESAFIDFASEAVSDGFDEAIAAGEPDESATSGSPSGEEEFDFL